VSDTNVIHSHFITTDTFLVFFVLLSFLGSSFVFTNGKMWHYVLAGAASGLAAAVKYPGGLVIISLLTAHFLRYGQRGFAEKKVYIGILCSAVAFVIAMPYSVLDFHSFFQDGILGDITHYTVGHAGAEFNTLYFYWTRFHFFEGPVYIFAVLGLILGLAKFRKQTLLLLSCGLPYFILISSLKVRFARTLMPVLVFVFLLASMFVVFFLPRLFKDKVLRRCVIGIVILLMVAIPLPRTIYEVKKLAIVDSRDTARIWINENLPAKSKIVIENYSPFIDAKKFSLVRVPTLSRNPPELFKDVDYLVFSEGVYRRYVDDRENYPDLAEGYSALWNSMSLVKNFTDGNFTVMIYTPR
jgi:4-amino-4-deoxy-L-arabinose transferase-like glycosyltransferase